MRQPLSLILQMIEHGLMLRCQEPGIVVVDLMLHQDQEIRKYRSIFETLLFSNFKPYLLKYLDI